MRLEIVVENEMGKRGVGNTVIQALSTGGNDATRYISSLLSLPFFPSLPSFLSSFPLSFSLSQLISNEEIKIPSQDLFSAR